MAGVVSSVSGREQLLREARAVIDEARATTWTIVGDEEQPLEVREADLLERLLSVVAEAGDEGAETHEPHPEAVKVAQDWLYEDNHGLRIPGTEWGRDLKWALGEFILPPGHEWADSRPYRKVVEG